ncbi:MAG TPA: alkaline phosphatase family protein [Actinomycetota bacterium]|nr:alkaline phosphatase family protein [Actinomycetota bacterium]
MTERIVSRRAVLKGMAAGAGVGLAGPMLRGVALGSGSAGTQAAGSGAGTLPYPLLAPGTDTLPQIEHIVVLMMENHSFDCYFGMLGRGDGFTLGANGQPTATNPDANANPVPATHAANLCQQGGGVSQSWDASHSAYDDGRNDGFVIASSSQAMWYWTESDLPFYYALARTFPVCDRYFSSVMAQTYPNRRFLQAASAFGLVDDSTPSITTPSITAPPPPNGTIFDSLSAHGISWKNYFVDLPTTALFPYQLTRYPGNIVPAATFLTDAALGTLPSFSLVDPEAKEGSEESPQDIAIGAAYASVIVDAVLTSPAWPKTLLILAYDEHGGYFDHVPPPAAVVPDGIPPDITVPPDLPGGYDRYGFRVPAVIVSPWAKPGYVSHVVHDHTSILKLIETKWNLPALSARDAAADNLLDSLDFGVPSPPFLKPPALPGPNLDPSNLTCFLGGLGTIGSILDSIPGLSSLAPLLKAL